MSAGHHRIPDPGYKDYVQTVPSTWWLQSRPYFLFMVRELTAVFVMIFALHLLSGVIALSQGEAFWNAWVARAAASKTLMLGGLITLFFLLYHSVTWFIAGAAVTPVQIGEFKVSVPMFVLGNMGLVVVVAAIIGYFTLGG